MAAEVRRSPERALARTARSLSPSDQQLLSRPDSAEAVKQAFAEAFRSGSRGVAWEFVLLARPWGFRLEEIAVPVHLWHGEDDWSAPIAMGRYLASAIPDCQATFLPGEGHFMIAGRMEQILDALRP
jgi:pimeloyl-ACP methyl ester carboxylesterase